MPRKRPTESSWDSDEELLGDTSSVSAFSSKKGGDDEIDEDALLGFSDEGIQEYSEGAEYSFTTSEIDIGLDSSAGLNVTAGSQELDYEDLPEEAAEEFVLEENTEMEDTLMVDEQPNATTCAVQSTEPSEVAEEDSDDESNKRDRGRFQTERKTTNITSHSKASSIPDSLEITKEMQAEIDTFEKQKGKFNYRGRGRQQQRFQNQNARGRGQMRGANMPPRMQGPGGRLMGPRSAGPNRLRSPQGFQRPMGQPMRQNSSPGMPRPLMFNHRPRGPSQGMNRGPVPRFSHEMVRPTNHGPRPDNTPRQPIPQPYMSNQPMPMQPMYTDQSNYSQPAYSQSVHTQPQPVHSQPHVIQSQPAGSTIHVNPKFQGGLPSSVQQSSQHALLPHSVPQPVYSQHQPIQSYQESQQAWAPQHHHGQPVSMHSTSPGGYPQAQQMYPPQPVPLLPNHQNRPGILGANPSALMPPPDHQRQPEHSNMNMQNAHHIQPRPLLQAQQHRPNQQHQHVRHMGPPHNSNQHGPRNPHPGPHQVRPQRPVANQNIRGPRPANQMSGNVRQMRPPGGQEFKPRNPQGNQRFKTPHPVGQTPSQGWNPTPDQLAASVKTEEDPDKERKLKEMEEKKRLRAERFKMNTPVQVNAGSPSNKKVIATKRPSGEEPTVEEISPAKSVRIETLATMKTDSSSVNSEDALKKALEEQKKRRELIMKIKEAKRQALAEQKRKTLAQKLAKEGKSTVEDNQPMEIQQVNQQQAHNQQFTAQDRGRGRGQKLNRGRGQGHVNMGGHGQGQPISVVVQTQPNLIQIPVDGDQMRGHGFNEGQGQSRGQGLTRGRGHGPTRGVIMNRGRGRGVQSVPNVVQLQQVEIQDSAMYDNGVNRTLNEPSNNRTVLSSSVTRQVIGMNPRGAATQVVARGRKVIDKSEESPAPRRIVVNSLEPTQSSTVLIKDLPAKVDLGKVNKKCAQHGNIKSFNYKADAKQIVVQYSSPAEAAAFLKKNPKFMIDMGYLTASSIPDGSM